MLNYSSVKITVSENNQLDREGRNNCVVKIPNLLGKTRFELVR